MNSVLLAIGSVFAVLAAGIHVYIFILESFRWTLPATWRIFGIRTQEDANTTELLAYNQGFYNLFLAVGAVLGILIQGQSLVAGSAVTLFACASMVMAATVLISTSRSALRPALIQGLLPALAIAFTTAGLLAG